MSTRKLLIPLPTYGFDPTEVAIPWSILSRQGVKVVFATPDGKCAAADHKILTGQGLGIFRKILMARQDAVVAYRDMEKDHAFQHPMTYADLKEIDFNGLLLPGGHDKGVRAYLESSKLHQVAAEFFFREKPVAAICHGVVLAARSNDPETKRSVIHNYKTTSLLKSQELTAFNITRLWLGDYYLTYPGLTVEDEVKSVLRDAKHFIIGPMAMMRDDFEHLSRGFVVRDRNYLSARWPGDAYNFALELARMME